MKRSGLILFTILTSAAYLPLVSAKSKASVKHYVLPEIKPGEDSLLNTPEKKKISNVSFYTITCNLARRVLVARHLSMPCRALNT